MPPALHRTVTDLIHDMPSAQRGRGRTLYERGIYDAATDLEGYLGGLDPLDSAEWAHAVEIWIKEKKG